MGTATGRDATLPRTFARRVKLWALAGALAAFGVTWGLVSQNVVGATNVTPHQASVPSSDFFSGAAGRSTPVNSSGTTTRPIVRSGAS
jgi:hypothetical protein